MAVRTTQHRGRTSKKDAHVFTASHNDRDFNSTKATHIDPERSKQNIYWYSGAQKHPGETFSQAEARIYTQLYEKGLNAKNERYIKSRHKERCKSIQDTLQSPKTAPEEILVYLGDKSNHVDAKTLYKVFIEQIQWEAKTFPNVITLDFALHMDEATPHIHQRVTWIGHDKDGNAIPNQSKALEEMGIERPDPSKPKDRYNNPKQTYTRLCREHFQELCKAHGIDLIEEAKPEGQRGLDLTEYKLQKATEELQHKQAEIKRLEAERETMIRNIVNSAMSAIERWYNGFMTKLKHIDEKPEKKTFMLRSKSRIQPKIEKLEKLIPEKDPEIIRLSNEINKDLNDVDEEWER